MSGIALPSRRIWLPEGHRRNRPASYIDRSVQGANVHNATSTSLSAAPAGDSVLFAAIGNDHTTPFYQGLTQTNVNWHLVDSKAYADWIAGYIGIPMHKTDAIGTSVAWNGPGATVYPGVAVVECRVSPGFRGAPIAHSYATANQSGDFTHTHTCDPTLDEHIWVNYLYYGSGGGGMVAPSGHPIVAARGILVGIAVASDQGRRDKVAFTWGNGGGTRYWQSIVVAFA